jgi:TolB protein
MVTATWSPTRTSFAEAWAPPDKPQRIYIFNPDGTGYHPLTNSALPDEDSSPNWSPDGQSIVFNSNSGRTSEIYVVKIDGTGLVQLTHDNSIDLSPIWQPFPILSH